MSESSISNMSTKLTLMKTRQEIVARIKQNEASKSKLAQMKKDLWFLDGILFKGKTEKE